MSNVLLTTVVGSYPQPDWLVDRENLANRLPPRVRARDIWRVEGRFLEQAQDDATRLAIRDMELAGIDIISDGEQRRESYSNRFATALAGVDIDNPGTAIDRAGYQNPVPRIVSSVRRMAPVERRAVEFLRRHSDRQIKITVPGPFTMTQQAQDDYYRDERALAMDFAAAVNDEIRDLQAAGADVIQIDEPYLAVRPDRARAYGVPVINRALDGISGTTALHVCFGYTGVSIRPEGYPFLAELADCLVQQISIAAAQPNLDLSVLQSLPRKTIILGVLNLSDPAVETPDTVAARIRAALRYVPPDRLVPAPDCGMKYLSRELAFAKLRALAEGARMVRAELQDVRPQKL
jgi:5-methyltetrahydropteroyltriglutamate--homocysteine methyltransferase